MSAVSVRRKYWQECSPTEKAERMRNNARDLQEEIDELQEQADRYLELARLIESGELDPAEPPV